MECSSPIFSSLPESPNIKNIENIIYSSRWTYPHISSSIELLCVRKGKLTLILENKNYSGSVGDIFFVPSHIKHQDCFPKESVLEIFLVQFTWKCEEIFFNTVNNDLLTQLPQYKKFRIMSILDDICYDTGPDYIDHILANTRLHMILISLYRDIFAKTDKNGRTEAIDENVKKDRRHMLTVNAKKFIEANFDRPISLDDIANYLKVSPFYISRIFNKVTGISIIDYLNEIRLQKALQYIKEGRLVVADIAEKTGFSSAHYFTKVFKRRFGITPSQFSTPKPRIEK